MIVPYVFALFYADLLFDISISCGLRAIKNIKRNGVSVALNLCENAVFALCLCFDIHIVLRHSFEHICTLSDIYNLIIDLDAVYPCAAVFVCIAVFDQPCNHILYVIICH